jgi:hypothetical protein
MTHETQPLNEPSPEPTKEIISEMSFGAAMRRAIDDLFVCQAIGEREQQIPPNDVLPVLLESWKQELAERLKTEALSIVGNVAAILDLLQADESLSAVEPLEWLQAERWHTPFPVATVHRENLRSILSEGEIAGLSDADMTQIAAKMGEAFQYSDIYWQSLEAAAKAVLEEKQAQPDEPLASNTASSQPEAPTP